MRQDEHFEHEVKRIEQFQKKARQRRLREGSRYFLASLDSVFAGLMIERAHKSTAEKLDRTVAVLALLGHVDLARTLKGILGHKAGKAVSA